jgi:hypothetical protein
MKLLIDQTRAAADEGHFFAALVLSLIIPDICGALADHRGTATSTNYRTWLEAYAGYDSDPEEARRIYGFRCSLLHQGRMRPHRPRNGPSFEDFPLAFIEPNSRFEMHDLSTVAADGSRVGWISIPMFVARITDAADSWFDQYGETATVKRNLEKFVQRRPNGLPPHLAGVAVFA